MTIYVCAPHPYTYRTVHYCPVCERRRRFIVRMYVWYGADHDCCGCGYRFNSDGYQRPAHTDFRSRARALMGTDKLRAEWRSMRGTRKQAEDALYAEVTSYVTP